jgi:2',3'-cyclic-nucleotide 2'-phosphodiesterase (5'-nucleotidase family)
MFLRLFTFFFISCFCLGGCKPQKDLIQSQHRLYSINQDLPVDSSVVAFYQPYKIKIDSQVNVVVAHADAEIKRGKPEGRLNNLTADAVAAIASRENISFDFVHINYKTLRTPLPQGPIKVFKIFELMPFENVLVALKLKGDDVDELFQYMARRGGDPVSKASFVIQKGAATTIRINGEPLDKNRTYTVLTNDYMANGGDEASVYLKAISRKDYKLKLRDMLLQYLSEMHNKGEALNPKIDGRVLSDKPFTDE